jgi:hypothetical protein
MIFRSRSRFGGYDVVNGCKGGWATIFHGIPSAADVKEAPASNRVKKVYERMLLEYERRCDEGWDGTNPPSLPLLTAGEVFMPAGWGIPQNVADLHRDGLRLLAAAIPRGEGPVIISVEDALARRAREQGEHLHSSGLETAVSLPASSGADSSGVPTVHSTSFVSAHAPNPVPAAPVLEAARLKSEELFVRKITVGSASYTYGVASQVICSGNGRPLDLSVAMDDIPLDIPYSVLPSRAASNLWTTSGFAVSPVSSPVEHSSGPISGVSWAQQRFLRIQGAATASRTKQRLYARNCMCCGVLRAGGRFETSSASAPAPAADDSTEDEREPPSTAISDSATAPPRAWAMCSHCTNVVCFSCLFPTPASAGFETASELTSFLDDAVRISLQNGGAASEAGYRSGASDAGLWACPSCTVSRTSGWPLPWCGICHTSVAAPAVAPDDSFFGCLASPVDFSSWPVTVRCETCSCKMHAQCAARSGVVVVEVNRGNANTSALMHGVSLSFSSALRTLELPSASDTSDADKATATKRLSAFYCRSCALAVAKPSAPASSAAAVDDASLTLAVQRAKSSLLFQTNHVTRESIVRGKLL